MKNRFLFFAVAVSGAVSLSNFIDFSRGEHQINGEISTSHHDVDIHSSSNQKSLAPEKPTTGLKQHPLNSQDKLVGEYIDAMKGNNRSLATALWKNVRDCEPCLRRLITLLVNDSFDSRLQLDITLKMVALETTAVLPAFHHILNPEQNHSSVVILSENLIKDGRPEYVHTILLSLAEAEQNGYQEFSQQLSWIFSRLDNPEGLKAILEAITGDVYPESGGSYSPAFAKHLQTVMAGSISDMPKTTAMASSLSEYYLSRDVTDKVKLWPVVKNQTDALILMAEHANKNSRTEELEKYLRAITELPDTQAIDGVMSLSKSIRNSREDYLVNMIRSVVGRNPDEATILRLADHVHDLNLSTSARIVAAEGLLSAEDNEQAHYFLNNIVSDIHYEHSDPELIAYLSGRIN